MRTNRLATEKVSQLLFQFALPSVVAMLVTAFYNIVDQLFIGHSVGVLGNAATNVAFPLVTICASVSLLFGIGGAANFNLNMGAGHVNQAKDYIGNAVVMMGVVGTILFIFVRVFSAPMLHIFGATEEIMPYALAYTNVTSLGFPFLIFSTGGSALIRADGSPVYSMIVTMIGAVLNIFLDYVFVIVWHMGMEGAALATVIGQIVSAILVAHYMIRYKTVSLEAKNFHLQFGIVKRITSLGMSPSFHQITLLFVQIIMNNMIKTYGQQSIYGSEIPLAVIGIAMKVNMIFFSMAIGIAQGAQPIISFNYGAKNYERVKEVYLKGLMTAVAILSVAFILFQCFPVQIIQLFGNGEELYFEFAKLVFRIFLFTTFLNAVQPVTGNFMVSIGKASIGIFISLTRQVIFFIPLAIILPQFIGIRGILYTGPIADVMAFLLATYMAKREFIKMDQLEGGIDEIPIL